MLTLSAFSQTATSEACDTCETALPDYILRKGIAEIEKGRSLQQQIAALSANIYMLKKKLADKDSIIHVLQMSDTAYVSIISSNSLSYGFLKKQLADCNSQAAKLKKAEKKHKKHDALFKFLTALITVTSAIWISNK